jgi:hypothetical protein
VADQFEMLVIEQRFDVPACAGEEVVHAKHLRTFANQAFADMGAKEAGTACHQNAVLKMHRLPERQNN